MSPPGAGLGAMPVVASGPLPLGGEPGAPQIQLDSVASGYYGKRVLEDVTFRIDDPAIYVVLGPNGAGKTTLFRTIAGILHPYTGTIRIRGIPNEAVAARTQLHYLTHVDGIPDGLRVAEALRFYADIEHVGEEAVARTLHLLELDGLQDRYFSQLSQGQKKRVSVARIFLREKNIYLLDEPTSNLDPKMAGEIRELILRLSRNKVVLYSSHNLYEAREIGSHVIAIVGGRLAKFGRIDDIRTDRYVIGIRTLGPDPALASFRREGDYYTLEIAGPEEVPKLVAELSAKGVQIREVREMENPLESLFR